MNNWPVCDALRELSLAFQDAIVDALPATGRGAV
jgi:hypothetical protein